MVTQQDQQVLRIKKVSRVIKTIIRIWMVLMVLGLCGNAIMLVVAAITPQAGDAMGENLWGLTRHPQSQPLMLTCAVLAASLVRGCLAVKALWHLQKLFGLFSNGQVFTAGTVGRIKSFGYYLLAYGLVSFTLGMALLPNPMTMAAPYSSAFAMGLVVIFISWAMDEGRKINEEQELVI